MRVPGLQRLQLFYRFPPHLIEQRRGSKRRARDLNREAGELIGGVAQTPELFCKERARNRSILRRLQRRRRRDIYHDLRAPDQMPLGGERVALARDHVHRNGLTAQRSDRLGVGTGDALQIRVVGAPYQISGADAVEADFAVAEFEFYAAVSRGCLVDAASLFRFSRTSPVGCIEDYAVAGFQGSQPVRGVVSTMTRSGSTANAAHLHSTMTRRAAIDHRLMIGSGEEEVPRPRE